MCKRCFFSLASLLLIAGSSFAQSLVNEAENFTAYDDPTSEFFPGNLFELRPPHVRKSSLAENSSHPRSIRSFPFFEPPPPAPPQSSVILRDIDDLAVVYPVSNGAFSSLGSYRVERLDIQGNRIVLDVFTVPLDVVGNAVVAANEAGFFVGSLEAGDYEFELRLWSIPGEYRNEFDADNFDPSDYLAPTYAPTPIDELIDLNRVTGTLEPLNPATVIVPFRVLAVPEATTFGMTALSLLVLVTWRRLCGHLTR
jgi:hypothetical protein